MRLFDENRRIIESPEVVEHVLAQVRSDAAIDDPAAWRARKTWQAENEVYITGAALA